jgi:hypothetical protein
LILSIKASRVFETLPPADFFISFFIFIPLITNRLPNTAIKVKLTIEKTKPRRKTSRLERLKLYLKFSHAEAQRTQRAISNEKARFLLPAYSYHENKKMHVENIKFGNNT